ncbi:MAG: hypothetical protein Fur002_10950 [Anaerolineales bacterium]
MNDLHVTRWQAANPPTEALLREIMRAQGLQPYAWSNSPFDSYAPHKHNYHKVIYVVSGSVTFGMPALKKKFELKTGDRLDLPAGIIHDAQVGAQGVVCLEGHVE